MIRFACPKCDSRLEFADDAAGTVVRCPECRAGLKLPGRKGPARKPAAAPPPEDDPPVEAEVVRPKKRRRRRDAEEGSRETPEWVAPTILLGVGLLLSVVGALLAHGVAGTAGLLLVTAIMLAVIIPANIAGMYVAAAVVEVQFGQIWDAALKIAAITVTMQGVNIILTIGDKGQLGAATCFALLIQVPLSFGLFCWLFKMSLVEAFVSTIVIGVVSRVVIFVMSVPLIGFLKQHATN
jgi:hypothetical protein